MSRASPGALLAAAALAGCSLAPAYAPPAVPTPPAYKEIGPWTPASPADAAPRGDWWAVYDDPLLDALERRIDTANPDLAYALARYDEARADEAQARAALVPELDFNGTATTNRQSANRPLRLPGGTDYYADNNVGGSVSYEFDLWGRVRNMVAASKAQSQASAADTASIRLSLEAQLADAYLTLRGLDADAELLAQTTDAYAKALKLTQALFNGGAVARLDVSRAETQLQAAEALQTDVAAQRAVYEHEIADLVGEPPAALSIAPRPRLPSAPRAPVAAPSLILQRRPDIAAAERRAAAATAMIGVARAAFYPTVTLDALGGYEDTGGLNLLSVANSWWTLGPSVTLPIFDAGRRKAALRAAWDELDEAGATYRSTVLAAFQQVEDNLALCNKLAVESDQQAAAVRSAELTESLAMVQYRLGEVTYLDVVTAQTTELQAQIAELAIETRRLTASVDLVRALGGGWSGAMIAPTPPPRG
jgi:multidrug efflux system outer membrane protein